MIQHLHWVDEFNVLTKDAPRHTSTVELCSCLSQLIDVSSVSLSCKLDDHPPIASCHGPR